MEYLKWITPVSYGRLLFVLFIAFFYHSATAQQDHMYSNYMFNTLSINPAYAGSREALNATALYRRQWLGGVEGAPITQTFSLHAPLKNEKVGLGLNISNDKIAIQSNLNIQLCYAYIINLGVGKLSLGLQAGAISYTSDYSKITFTNAIDEKVERSSTNNIHPSFGAGLYFHSDKVFLGLSAPRISAFQSKSIQEVQLSPHYFANFGANINLGESVIFRPSTLIKLVGGAPLQADLNTTFIYKNLLGLGASYRTTESLIGLVQLHIGKIKIGYAYDYGLGAISKLSSGSHEIAITFETVLTKDKVVSPRFF